MILMTPIRAIAAFIAVLLVCASALAQENAVVLSPGVKFGYAFGDHPGFLMGLEVSLVKWPDIGRSYYAGALLSVERIGPVTKIHLGAEGGGIAGISLGPSILFKEGEHDVGVTVTAYALGIVIPYMSTTHCFTFDSINEAGSYVKMPIFLKGSLDNAY